MAISNADLSRLQARMTPACSTKVHSLSEPGAALRTKPLHKSPSAPQDDLVPATLQDQVIVLSCLLHAFTAWVPN